MRPRLPGESQVLHRVSRGGETEVVSQKWVLIGQFAVTYWTASQTVQ